MNNQVTHTPGPWDFNGAQIVKYGEDWACIAEVNNPRPLKSNLPLAKPEPLDLGHPRFHEACANARLIAAAPELLESLKGLMAEIKNHFPNVARPKEPNETASGLRAEYLCAMEVIDKAEGKQ